MADVVASLKALIGLDSSGYEAGVRRVKGASGGLEATMSRLKGVVAGAFSVGAIVSWGKSVFDTMAGISKSAENLRITSAEMAGLSAVAAESGLPFEQLGNLMGVIQRRQNEVSHGNETYGKTLKDMGITTREFISMDPAQALLRLAGAASESELAVAQLAQLIGDDLGRKAVSMLNILAKDGIGQIDDATANAIDEIGRLDDEWAKFKANLKIDAIRVVVKTESARESIVKGLSDLIYDTFVSDVNVPRQGVYITGSQETKQAAMRERDREAAEFERDFVGPRITPEQQAQRGYTDALNAQLTAIEEEARQKELAAQRASAQKDLEREQETIQREMERSGEYMARQSFRPDMPRADALLQVGGLMGGTRADIQVQDKALQEHKASRLHLAEIQRLNERLVSVNEQLAALAGGGVP